MYNFHIDSHGRMSICTMTRQPNFSILENGFLEAWSHIGELRKLKRQKETICQTCTLGALCQQCPGWSQAAHGDNETPVEFVCKLAHLRNTQISGV
jgi:radical SAM protein with 4Fe4S-binding SPASM domain